MPDSRIPYPCLITCEHAVYCVPQQWSYLFDSEEARHLLETHRGWDPGAADLTLNLAKSMQIPCILGQCSRLLVELNRSVDNPELWSRFSSPLTSEQKESILCDHYRPFRNQCLRIIRKALAEGHQPVLHLSIHTFTPVLKGEIRQVDIGILLDPARPLELAFACNLMAALRAIDPNLQLAMNQPYLGTDDGHTTSLRKALPASEYLGIELEINQAAYLSNPNAWIRIKQSLLSVLKTVCTL